MSKYTARGSRKLDARIDADMAHIAEAVAPLCVAGILLGGYGRGEGTPFINPDGTQVPFNDYDLVVIEEKVTPALRKRLRQLEQQLSAELGLPVDLCPYQRDRLRQCSSSLLNYEMKRAHRVIWGAENILDAMPDFRVPLSEGTRLLLNRARLLLNIQTAEERVRSIKFIHKMWLAFGDCALLAEDRYDISYSGKAERIRSVGAIPDREAIIEGYLKAIELKQWGNYRAVENFDLAAELKTVGRIFARFYPWYRKQYSALEKPRLKNAARHTRWHVQFCKLRRRLS